MAKLLRRHLAWPDDHGTWAFLLSPLIIGLALGGRWTATTLYLVVAVSAGLLVRQPATVAVKTLSGRRGRAELGPALAWTAFYGLIGVLHAVGLALRGYAYLLWLALPGMAVFVWYLALVARRAERRRLALEVLAAGVLALAAPAGLWAGRGEPSATGWLLWLLTWAHSASSIVFVHLRLGRRRQRRSVDESGGLAQTAALGAGLPLALVAAGGLAGWLPRWLFLAYLVQAAEVARFLWRPGPDVPPSRIGLRQAAATALYILLFLATWA